MVGLGCPDPTWRCVVPLACCDMTLLSTRGHQAGGVSQAASARIQEAAGGGLDWGDLGDSSGRRLSRERCGGPCPCCAHGPSAPVSPVEVTEDPASQVPPGDGRHLG